MGVFGDFIKGAGSFIGDIGNLVLSDRNRDQERSFINQQNRQSEALQREFAQSGVQWRVQDAQKAGVHPLFALGGSGAGFTPSQAQAVGQAPPDFMPSLDSALTASRTTDQSAIQKAQLELLASGAEKNRAEADYFNSAAARNRQQPVTPWPEMTQQTATDQITYRGAEDERQVFNPFSDAIVRRANPEQGIAATELPFSHGTHTRPGLDNPDQSQPGWSMFEFGDGPIVLPYTPKGQGLMEALEGLDAKYLPIVVAEQRRRFGNAGVARLMKLYEIAHGPTPKQRSKALKAVPESMGPKFDLQF